MGGKELEFVQQAFADNWIAPVGPFIGQFESALAAYAGLPHCAALSSGTAAIHLALIALGIKEGDEVVCSSFTFSGSCNPIAYLKATPVFIDSERTTWNMDPSLLEFAIHDRLAKTGTKPKAIILVHLYGMPARIEQIIDIAARHGIPVVEDAAEALGSTRHGRKLGSFGDLSIFSFNGNKIITTSGGGALLSSRQDYIQRARFLATQARDPAPHYEHSEIGYNYRLSNICAGIGLGQLEVLDNRVARRRAIFELYRSNLGLFNMEFPIEEPGSISNRWLTTILLDNSELPTKIMNALEVENIESRPLWKPMHSQPVFRGFPAYTNGVSDDLFARGLCLPSGSNLVDEEVLRVVDVIRAVLS